MATTTTTKTTPSAPSQWMLAVRTYLRGAAQVMFQQSSWTGLLFLAGIFVGSYMSGVPQVAWGAAVGLAASTLSGYMMREPVSDGDEGLWGFNGILVGCAFPTFMANTWLMWVSLVFFAMATTWVRCGFNNVMAPWKVNSFTFPFVFLTWIFLLGARMMMGVDASGLSKPELTDTFAWSLNTDFGHLVEYWLKGVAQVFLVNNWITGVLFLVGLFMCSRWAAIWAALGSAISLALAILFKVNPSDIENGLFGFSPVLTAIALGCTFYQVNWRTALWSVAGIAATFFIQAAMDVMLAPLAIPTLTGPFCVTTWLFLLPLYRLGGGEPDHTRWRDRVHELQQQADAELTRAADDIEKKI